MPRASFWASAAWPSTGLTCGRFRQHAPRGSQDSRCLPPPSFPFTNGSRSVADHITGSIIDVHQPSKQLQAFSNPKPERDYEIRFDCPEFTCLCPLTGQPDFASIRISYVPNELCIELKSLKLYLWSHRDDEGAFHERSPTRLPDDIVAVIAPVACASRETLPCERIGTVIVVEHTAADPCRVPRESRGLRSPKTACPT